MILALCAGNPPVTGGFPSQRPVTGALVFSLICAPTKGWPNNRDADDLRCHRAHYDVTVMIHRTGKSVILEPSKPITSGRNWFITVYWFIDGTDIRVLTPAKWTLCLVTNQELVSLMIFQNYIIIWQKRRIFSLYTWSCPVNTLFCEHAVNSDCCVE